MKKLKHRHLLAAHSKRLAELEHGAALVIYRKQATDSSLPETEGVTIGKAFQGDREAVEKLVGFIKSAKATRGKCRPRGIGAVARSLAALSGVVIRRESFLLRADEVIE